MKPIKHKIPSTHEEWLSNRLKGIGGSDAGAILGFNKYKSPYSLWCEKTGRIKNEVDNESMRIGRDLEDYVAKRFTEQTGLKVKKSNFSYQSAEHPFMLANVDRLIVGEKAGLECKTTNMLTKTRYDKGDIPASYYAQCMHYMAVTGLEKWYIAILVLGKDFHVFEINRDEDEINGLIQAEEDFWKFVEKDEEPPIDGEQSTSEALSGMYSPNGESIELFGREDVIEKYKEVSAQMDELKNVKTECENILKRDLGDCEKGSCGGYYINWKQVTSNRVDSTKLKKEFPEVYNQCVKASTSRRFEIKEAK